jgi:CHAT domain
MSSGRAVIEVSLLEGAKRQFAIKVVEGFNAALSGKVSIATFGPRDAAFNMRKPSASSTAMRVVRAGQRLFRVLSTSGDAKLVFGIMSRRSEDEAPVVYPLYVKLDSSDAERVPWEMLWSKPPGGFVALHPNCQWPIARMAASSVRAAPLRRKAGSTVRIAVVLGAAAQDGASEWQMLANAFEATTTPAELLVIVSDEAAHAAVTASLQAWGAGQAGKLARSGSVVYVADQLELVSALAKFEPNIVHFWCHGAAEPLPRLEIEVRSDRRRREGRASIQLGATDLERLASASSLWLIVLNCCQGATPATNLHSLARDLVVSGAPVVVAMRESVEVADANLFTEAFYGALFPQLQTEVTAKASAAGLDGAAVAETLWLGALFTARRRLSGDGADDEPKWTYPVAYVHRDELRVVATRKGDNDEEQRSLRYTLDFLEQVRTALLESTARGAGLPVSLARLNSEIAGVRQKLGLTPEDPSVAGVA